MPKLKSAYNLANERVVISHYQPRDREDDFKDYTVVKEENYIPDFVEDWKRPYDNKLQDVVMVGDWEQPIVKKEIPKDIEGIKLQEPQTIYPERSVSQVPQVHWYGHFTNYTGFGRTNRALTLGLTNMGINVKIDMEEAVVNINNATMDQLRILSNNDISPKAPKIYHAIMPLSFSHNGKKILYTMMENADTLHKDYVEKLNLFHEVWVPTEYGAKVYKKNGVKVPILVMPLGVDTTRYCEKAKPFDFGVELNSFKFLSVFRWTYRKGYDILLKAYMEEFSSQDDVSLVLVSRRIEDQNSQIILDEFSNIRNSVNKSDDDLPNICLYDQPIGEQHMPGVYTACNCFTLISRGEGTGLPYLESASCGLPVIGSNCTGQTDFLNNSNSYLVEPDDYVNAEVNGKLSKMAKMCRFYEGQKFPDFDDTGVEQTRKHMRFVYENYSEAKLKSLKLTQEVRDKYTWENTLRKIYKRVLELQERKEG